jgi:glycosyltransferase involved in cell wall biosynthesis
MSNKIKVAVLYRVVQEWRRPIFDRLHAHPDLSLTLYHGPDFAGSKVVSSKKPLHLPVKKLWSIKLRKESKNGLIAMPLSPFLLFSLLRDRPDVVVTEGASNLFNALVGFIYCKLMGKKFIWWSLGRLSGTVHTGFRKKLDNLIQYLERKSDAIISYSSLGKDYFTSIGVLEERVFVAVNVVDTTSKLKELAAVTDRSFVSDIRDKARMVVLFVGALTSQKKLDVLVRGFGRFVESAPDTRLIIVGDGTERQNIERIIREESIPNIEMTGKVFNGVQRYFISADVFVLPGLGGLAVSEAMLYGVPVIASIGDGCEKDLITPGVSGIIDEKLDEESLSQHLTGFYENPEKLAQFKKEAAKTIEDKHNLESYLSKVVAAIKS